MISPPIHRSKSRTSTISIISRALCNCCRSFRDYRRTIYLTAKDGPSSAWRHRRIMARIWMRPIIIIRPWIMAFHRCGSMKCRWDGAFSRASNSIFDTSRTVISSLLATLKPNSSASAMSCVRLISSSSTRLQALALAKTTMSQALAAWDTRRRWLS